MKQSFFRIAVLALAICFIATLLVACGEQTSESNTQIEDGPGPTVSSTEIQESDSVNTNESNTQFEDGLGPTVSPTEIQESDSANTKPSDHHIMFLSAPKGSNDFRYYVTNTDGSDMVDLPGTPYWSPTGTEFAYVFDDGNTEKVLLANLETGQSVDLTQSMTYTEFSEPVWSPDGSRLLISGFGSDGSNSALLVVDRTGNSTTKILDTHGGLASDPNWSPDSSLIGFNSGHDAGVVRPDGSEEMSLTGGQDIGFIDGIYWSPDGQRVLLSTYGTGHSLYVVDKDGTDLVNLFNPVQQYGLENYSKLTDIAWAPDGRYVAFIADRSSPSNIQGDTVSALMVVKADGSNESWIYAVSKLDQNSAYMRFAWSPNGELLALNSAADGNPEVYVVKPGEDIKTNLSQNLSRDELPLHGTVWSPDGERIAFLSHRDGTSKIHILNVGSREVNKLTEHQVGENQTVSWSSTGRYVVFESTAEGNAEIYLADTKDNSVRNLTNSATSSEVGPEWLP